jgi:hypothetical protein
VADERNKAPTLQKKTSAAVEAFLDRARTAPPALHARGRLVFALDATISRQPTWDMAQALQAEMFAAAAGHGGLAVQLVYFRGFDECRASAFVEGGDGLARLMGGISCRAGKTQIGRVLAHARAEAQSGKIGALIFIGDAFEEQLDHVAHNAGELGLMGVRAFMFQEGNDPDALRAFQEIARLTGGACAAFDNRAPDRLRDLLGAVATYAAGGLPALARRAAAGEKAARLLIAQIEGSPPCP